MAEEDAGATLVAFRHHRHDVLNSLQVIRAYCQMGKVDRAIQAVDQLASWSRSITVWQICTTPADAELVWHAATCSQVELVASPSLLLTQLERSELKRVWTWLNDYGQQLGVRLLVELESLVASSSNHASTLVRVKPGKTGLPWRETRETLEQAISDIPWLVRFKLCVQEQN